MDRLGDVVFEDGRDVFLSDISILSFFSSRTAYLWKVALRVTNEQTGLAAATIAHDDKLLRVRGRLGDVGRLRHLPRRHACVCAVGAVAAVTDSNTLASITRAQRGYSWRRCLFIVVDRVPSVVCGGGHGCESLSWL